MKKIIFSLLAITLLFSLTACGKKNNNPLNQENKNQSEQETINIKGDIGNDVCQEFNADFIYSASNKAVVKVEPDKMVPKLACRFYFTYTEDFYKNNNKVIGPGGLHIFMMLENLNVVKQKEANEFLGLTVKTEEKIKMENMVNYRKDGSLYDIRLIINPNRYLRIDTNKGLTDEELIQFAAKVAEKIQGKLSFDIKSNPTDLGAPKSTETNSSQQAVVSNFLDDLANLKIAEALKIMDANDNTKQAWGVNFNTLISLKVNKLEEAFKEEWTTTRQSFKAELEVKVKPDGEKLGWQNGKNYRWITLEKNASGTWLVHELASNP